MFSEDDNIHQAFIVESLEHVTDIRQDLAIEIRGADSNEDLVNNIFRAAHSIKAGTGQRIDLLTSELHRAIMLTRMQPIGNVLAKFPRVACDLAKKLGKEVELTIVGKVGILVRRISEVIAIDLEHQNAIERPFKPSRRIWSAWRTQPCMPPSSRARIGFASPPMVSK
jgi:chemotaxis protein histidine kinase CheA